MTEDKSSASFSYDFIEGQKACMRGDDCPQGASDGFERGYNTQHTREQIDTHKGFGNVHN